MLHDRSLQVPDAGLDRVVRIAAEHADAVDRDARFPIEAITALRDEGLLGAPVPVAFGGQGATLADMAHQAQRLAGACAATGMIYAMHQIQVACILDHGLGQDWHRAFARRIAHEQLLLASITSEVGIGGDMRSSLCAVAMADRRFTLAKQASAVSYGRHADAFLITARTDAGAAPSDQVLVTVLRGDSVIEGVTGWDTLGMRGTCSGGFALAAAGDAEQILPTPFAEIASETMVPVSHLLWGAVWTGIAGAAVMRARDFLRAQARRHPGMALPSAPRLLEATGLLELMQARLRMLIDQYDASHALGDGKRAIMSEAEAGWPSGMALSATLNTVKHDVSRMCHDAVLQALLICGTDGYKNDSDFSVGRHLRDILSAQLMISNDRIAINTGAMLLVQRSDLGTL